MDITPETTIEEVLDEIPSSITYLTELGIRCIKCGAPVWDTLQEGANRIHLTAEQLDGIITNLKSMGSK